MKENEINPRLSNNLNNEFYDSCEYNNNQENTEFITFNKGDDSFSNGKSIYNPTNEITPIKFSSNTIYARPFHSIENFHKNRFTYNYKNNNGNKYSHNSMPINVIENDNYIYRKINVNKSQDFSPYFYNNKTYNKKINNRSQIYNGNTTDDCDSYLNKNLDSTYYKNNNLNRHQKMYLGMPMNYPLEEKYDNNNISDYSNEEQLIIYPEKKYIFVNESYFNRKNNEGILKPKNAETYEVKSIEYIPDKEHENKSISLGDYILKGGKNFKIRKNKSCNNININYIKNENEKEKEFDIKLLSNKKKGKEKRRRISSSDILNNIKIIKENFETKESNNTNNDNNLSREESNINKNKGGIVDLSAKKKYNTSFINQKKYNNNEYPKWKIVTSACLIQSWFRSLKKLKNSYKKNLHKIIIIQKVYKMHYKNKILSGKKKPNIYKNYKKEPKEDINNNNNIIYKNKNLYNKQTLPKYKKTIPIIYNPNSKEFNINNNKNNSLKDKIINKGTYFVPNSFRFYDTQYNIAILLIEKIIENKILKMYFNFLFNLKNYNKKETKSDDNASKKGIKLHLEPTKIKRNKIKNKSENDNFINKKKENSDEQNNNNIVLKDKEKYNFNPKQKFLLKKLFIRIWLHQSMALKNAKRTHKKDRIKNNINKKHLLFNNINKLVFEKIKQEVKRRKLIVCFNIINTKKYPNLKYALKKIKKFSKVRSNVLNNYASIIQNAFRFYLENKYKEEKK